MNIEYEKKIGKRIRYFREREQLTQDEVAARMQIFGCDITRSALAKLEVGQRHFYPDEIIALKEILKVEFNDIFYDIKTD